MSLAQRSMESPSMAAVYESRLWRRNWFVQLLQQLSFDREFALVTSALELRDDARVLDLGCGPGIYARPLAKRVPRGWVVGLDRSVAMLRRAATQSARESLENLGLARADAESLPMAGACVDAAVCCGALHLFGDASRALDELFRVLRPSGRLAIAAFRRREGRLAERFTRARRRSTGMDAYLPEELEAMLIGAGFSGVQCHHARGVWLVMSAQRPDL